MRGFLIFFIAVLILNSVFSLECINNEVKKVSIKLFNNNTGSYFYENFIGKTGLELSENLTFHDFFKGDGFNRTGFYVFNPFSFDINFSVNFNITGCVNESINTNVSVKSRTDSIINASCGFCISSNSCEIIPESITYFVYAPIVLVPVTFIELINFTECINYNDSLTVNNTGFNEELNNDFIESVNERFNDSEIINDSIDFNSLTGNAVINNTNNTIIVFIFVILISFFVFKKKIKRFEY